MTAARFCSGVQFCHTVRGSIDRNKGISDAQVIIIGDRLHIFFVICRGTVGNDDRMHFLNFVCRIQIPQISSRTDDGRIEIRHAAQFNRIDGGNNFVLLGHRGHLNNLIGILAQRNDAAIISFCQTGFVFHDVERRELCRF